MSRNHYIKPKQQYDLKEFFELVSKIEGIQYEDRGNDHARDLTGRCKNIAE